MKSLLIRIILAVSGYSVPIDELEMRLSVIAPVDIQVIDLANPQPDQNSLHYALVGFVVKPGIKLFLHSYYTGGLSGGKSYVAKRVSNIAIIPDNNERNEAVILHEIGHQFGLGHSDTCTVMAPQPCNLEFSVDEILEAKKYLKRRKK